MLTTNLAAGHTQNSHCRRINMAQLSQEESRAKKSNSLHNLQQIIFKHTNSSVRELANLQKINLGCNSQK